MSDFSKLRQKPISVDEWIRVTIEASDKVSACNVELRERCDALESALARMLGYVGKVDALDPKHPVNHAKALLGSVK